MKVVIAPLDSPATKPRVKTRRVKDADGKTWTLHVLDSASPTFGEDFRYVFQRNVARARRENRQLTGKVDADLGER